MDQAFFELHEAEGDAEVLIPRDLAGSSWSADQLRGAAVSGALARAAERFCVQRRIGAALRPARWSVDLHRPTRVAPTTTRARVASQGRRLALVDVELCQDDEAVARASLLLLAQADAVPGDVWSPPVDALSSAPPVPEGLLAEQELRRLYYTDRTGWTTLSPVLDNTDRKEVAVGLTPIVAGEVPSQFVFAGATADLTNLAAHWGSHGIEYINTDLTIRLVRLPEGSVIRIAAKDHLEQVGIATATADLWDSHGRFAIATITALGNARRTINPAVALSEPRP